MRLASRLDEPLHLRACRSTYIVMMGISGLPVWMGPFIFRAPGAPPVIAFGVVMLGLTFLWVHAFEVLLTSDSISYRTLWRGTRTLRLIDIERAAVETGGTEEGDRSRPMIRLALYPTAESGQDPIDINLKVFGLPEIRGLVGRLGKGGIEKEE